MKSLFLFILIGYNIMGQEWTFKKSFDMENPVAAGLALFSNGKIYLIGGYSDEIQDITAWIQSYDISANKWEISTNMLYPRIGHSGFVSGNEMFFYGGIQDTSYFNQICEYWNLNNSEPPIQFSQEILFNRLYSSSVKVGNKVYIFGGNPYYGADSTYYPYLVEYNYAEKAVTYRDTNLFKGELYPEKQMAVIMWDKIYLFGGTTNGVSKKIYEFTPHTKEFKLLPVEMLLPRAGGVAVFDSYHNRVLILGGFNESQNAIGKVEAFEYYGNGNYNIYEFGELEIPRSHLQAVLVGSDIYVIGGYNSSGQVIKEIEIFDSMVTSAFVNEQKFGENFILKQNYPNPFNPSTKIEFSLNGESKVNLIVYSIAGEEVAVLEDKILKKGNYIYEFNSENYMNLSSGVYIYSLKNSDNSISKKMLLLK